MTDEEKEAIEILIGIREFANLSNYKDTKIRQLNAIDAVLNLIEKQSKEIEELKEECKEVVCIPEGTCFMLKPKDIDKKWEDKIKAIIEELQDDIKYSANPLSIDNSKFGIKVLQSFLEKE